MVMDANESEDVENLIENDPLLVPTTRSALLVESAVLDQQEVEALLADLAPMLLAAASDADFAVGSELAGVGFEIPGTGLNVAAQGMYRQTSFDTLFPDGGDGSADVGMGATAWVFVDRPFGVDLFGVVPAYRFSYYDPSSTFADDQLIENTLGVRWNVPVDGLPVSLFVDGTLLTETGESVRDLDNARLTALLQLEL